MLKPGLENFLPPISRGHAEGIELCLSFFILIITISKGPFPFKMLATDLGHMCFTLKVDVRPQLQSSNDITLFEYRTWHAVISRLLHLFPRHVINFPASIFIEHYISGSGLSVSGLLYQLQWLKLGMYMTDPYSIWFWPWWGFVYLLPVTLVHSSSCEASEKRINLKRRRVSSDNEVCTLPYLFQSTNVCISLTTTYFACSWRMSHHWK